MIVFFNPFWGKDVGAIKSSSAQFWPAKKQIIIDAWFITGTLTLIVTESWGGCCQSV